MRPQWKSISASPRLGAFWFLGPLCLLSGCSFLHPPQPPPSLSSIRAEGVGAELLAPVKFDAAPKREDAAALEVPTDAGGDAAAQPANGPTVFSLPQAVAFGLQNNPRLAAALAAIERARGEEQAAFAPFLPEMDLLTHSGVTSPKLGPASAGATGIIIPTNFDTHAYAQAELQLQWTLWDFGRTAGRYRQAVSRTRMAQLQSNRAVETVGYEIASAYLAALRAQAIRQIQEEAIRAAEASLRDTRSRRAAGVAERDDVLRAEVQKAAAEEDLDLAREAEQSALARLNNAMGRNAGLPLTILGWKSQPPLDLSLVKCLEMAADRRPEIGIAQQAVAAATSGRQAQAAEFLPRVYARASVGAVGGSNIAAGSQEGAGLHIDLPLYAGGRHQGQLRAADAEVRQAVADARSILDSVSLQVTLAYIAVSTARRRIEHDLPAILEARENLRLVGNRYRNGTATPTDIVDAQTALTRAQQRFASASYEYLAALVSLDYALGNPAGHLLGPPDPPDPVLPAPRPVH